MVRYVLSMKMAMLLEFEQFWNPFIHGCFVRNWPVGSEEKDTNMTNTHTDRQQVPEKPTWAFSSIEITKANQVLENTVITYEDTIVVY